MRPVIARFGLHSMSTTFDSFFQAGFECSSHRRRDGVRLDLIRATSHDKHVFEDYSVLAELGFRTLRDGLRWHLIEAASGKFDWSSWTPALEAAERFRAAGDLGPLPLRIARSRRPRR